jgi:hypothetical protein
MNDDATQAQQEAQDRVKDAQARTVVGGLLYDNEWRRANGLPPHSFPTSHGQTKPS